MDRTDHGRSLLHGWEDGRPRNYFARDEFLQAALLHHLGRARLAASEPVLRQAGADSAGPISVAAGVLDRPEHLPRLERWNGIGERVEEIAFHPTYHEIGRLVWRSGVLTTLGEPGNVTLHAALAYLFAHNGEVPQLCAVACTAGLIKAIQRAGTDWMRQRWLPRLLDPDYDRRWHGAQFLTEVQGGSDVGANACVARPLPGQPGAWRLSGEKWFCSNASADLYAVSARPVGAPEGTAGVALFVVPRRLDDGRPNGVHVRRLKNKLGTRTLPTAEIDFADALAYQLGALEDGFRLMMGVVINTSRLGVAIDCAGMMSRAVAEALGYARAREAFGRRLLDLPAVRLQLAEMRALTTAALASTLAIAAQEDRLVRSGARPEDDPLYRMSVNANKYVCSTDAALVVHHAMEVLGGNGTIEDFSALPRLYREVPVQESWEGPHNTLMAQMLRDATRGKMAGPFLDATRDLLLQAEQPALAAVRERALTALDDTRGTLEGLLRAEPGRAALHVRPLMHRVARLFQVGTLLQVAAAPVAAPAWLAEAAALLLARDFATEADRIADARYPEVIAALLEEPVTA